MYLYQVNQQSLIHLYVLSSQHEREYKLNNPPLNLPQTENVRLLQLAMG